MRAPLPLSACALLLVACAGQPQPEPDPEQRPHEHGHERAPAGHDDATVHHRFQDAARWAREFEDPARDAWQRPERVIELLGLAPDAKVVDVGSATGYFPVRFARAVPQGAVYGVDIEPTLVNYLNLRAHADGLTNLVSLVCQPDDPCIPEPVDLIFICDTYHHIDAREAWFDRLRAHLRPGGRLAIVDFRPGQLPIGPPEEKKIPPAQVKRELARAGWEPVGEHELPYQYLLLFRPR